MRTTKVIVHLKNLRENIFAIRSCIRTSTKLCVAVKADAYGHGAVPVAKVVVAAGANYLAVATVSEGKELRENGIECPILVLSLCSPEEIPEVVRYELTPFVFDTDYISIYEKVVSQRLNSENKSSFPVFLAVDTGMSRIGCMPEETLRIVQFISDCPHLRLGGISTHFAVSDSINCDDKAFTEKQFKRFSDAIESVRKAGLDPGLINCANSAAILTHPEMQFDMVRAGIIAYGYYPDQITESYLASKNIRVHLEPVMSLESEVVAIRPIKKGSSVSYGRLWTTPEDSVIAVLPIGYADGLLRRFSPGLSVTINGRQYPVRGRICMDQCMVEIGKDADTQVKRWDKAIIFGPICSGALQTAQDIAQNTGTISYEIMTSISKRVPRVYAD